MGGVIRGDDSPDEHFDDTLSGGDWLCDQDAVLVFVEPCKQEMVQLKHRGCRWSRKDDGGINVRFFGGLKVQRTWFAADKSVLHMPYMLFKTLPRYPEIQRFDEFFVAELKRGVARHAVRAAPPDGGAGHGNLDYRRLSRRRPHPTNKNGDRYLQDYGLGPPEPWPRPKPMEMGPRDRLSQGFPTS